MLRSVLLPNTITIWYWVMPKNAQARKSMLFSNLLSNDWTRTRRRCFKKTFQTKKKCLNVLRIEMQRRNKKEEEEEKKVKLFHVRDQPIWEENVQENVFPTVKKFSCNINSKTQTEKFSFPEDFFHSTTNFFVGSYNSSGNSAKTSFKDNVPLLLFILF